MCVMKSSQYFSDIADQIGVFFQSAQPRVCSWFLVSKQETGINMGAQINFELCSEMKSLQ